MNWSTQKATQAAQAAYEQTTNKLPGFFTPYSSCLDATKTVFYPLIYPFVLGACCFITTVLAAIVLPALAISAVALLFAGGAYCFGQKEIARTSAAHGLTAAMYSIGALAISVVSLLLPIVATVYLVSPITRTLATILNCCCSSTPETEEEVGKVKLAPLSPIEEETDDFHTDWDAFPDFPAFP